MTQGIALLVVAMALISTTEATIATCIAGCRGNHGKCFRTCQAQLVLDRTQTDYCTQFCHFVLNSCIMSCHKRLGRTSKNKLGEVAGID